jgi:hypothetical protein
MAHHIRNYRQPKTISAAERRCDPHSRRPVNGSVSRTMAALYLKRLKIALLNGSATQAHRVIEEFSVEAEAAAKEHARRKR